VRSESAVFPRVEGVDVKELPRMRGNYVVDVNTEPIYVLNCMLEPPSPWKRTFLPLQPFPFGVL
jgi:hypothetical protein